jgi:hypothetical protein
MRVLDSKAVKGGIAALTILFMVAGLFVIWTALSSAGPEEEEGKIPQPPPYEREPAPKVPRPDESTAKSLNAAREELAANVDLDRTIKAVESKDVNTLIELARKTDEYCGIYREVPEGCTSRDQKLLSVFYNGGTVYPKPVILFSKWLEELLDSNASLSLATRDSRKSAGDGGEYYLVFRGATEARVDDGSKDGPKALQGLALVVSPGKEEPIESFTFLGPDANGLAWLQSLDPHNGAKYQLLLAPESVKDWPGMWGETGD